MRLQKQNMIREIPLEWIVDPITKEEPVFIENLAHCTSGKYKKNTIGGYWCFIPETLEELNSPLWTTWKQLQRNGEMSYLNDPEHNLGIGPRQDFLDFADFCNFNGSILDVGCGPQKNPTHMKYCTNENAFFVGIDPLIGEQPREFAFVQGLAEYVPFRENIFDQVSFVTTLDHFIDPKSPLIEAQRVLKEDGSIFVWLGEKDKNAPPPVEKPDWYEKLKIPEGAEDQFHYKRISSMDFIQNVKEIGLKISLQKTIEIDDFRRNNFYCLRQMI